MSTTLLKQIKLPKKNKLQAVTFRGFGGGWNTVHDDISMDPRFLVTAKNVVRTASGASRVRFGSQWYADVAGTATGTIIDMEYFNGRLICVMSTGQIVSVDHPIATKTLIWSSAIATLLPGAPSGWTNGVTQVDFVPFRDQLIIHNGVDKPIIISNTFAVTYLQDLGSGSNINTPIGKYGCTVSNYHCVAGITGAPTEIYVSHTGTAGTFPGDAAPNDAINIDVGAYAPEGAIGIRGIAGFRTNLIVFFQSQSLVITLGEFDADGNHKPKFPDTLPQFGLLGHRCISKLSHDLVFNGLFGTSSAKRNLFSGLYDSKHLNEHIENIYRRRVSLLTDEQQQINAFSIYDGAEHTATMYMPDGFAFTYSFSEELRYRGWSYYEDQQWTCAAPTFLGRVFFGTGTRIYQKGNAIHVGEDYAADKILDRDGTWANNTAYVAGALIIDPVDELPYECLIAHTSAAFGSFEADREARPTYWELYEGRGIDFDIEMPWVDGRDPMNVKQLRFGTVGSKGTAEFQLRVYVDNLYKDEDGVEIYDPAVTLDLIGNDAPGYGADAGPMGGGRPSNDPRLYSIPCKFKQIKFRYIGSVRKPLLIASQSYLFSKGKFRR